MGPWRHSRVNYDGVTLGPLQWDGDTALQFRRDVLKPFFGTQRVYRAGPTASFIELPVVPAATSKASVPSARR
jgi:hypothetical protein